MTKIVSTTEIGSFFQSTLCKSLGMKIGQKIQKRVSIELADKLDRIAARAMNLRPIYLEPWNIWPRSEKREGKIFLYFLSLFSGWNCESLSVCQLVLITEFRCGWSCHKTTILIEFNFVPKNWIYTEKRKQREKRKTYSWFVTRKIASIFVRLTFFWLDFLCLLHLCVRSSSFRMP